MRKKVILQLDVEALLRKELEGLTAHVPQHKPFVQPVFDMGECFIPSGWSVQALADASEDYELLRK